MVRVYLARFQEESRRHEVQSKRVRRLLELALQKDYPDVCLPARLEKGEHGKPFLAGCPKLHISLSHSGAYVACAVAGEPVGVDVEAGKRRRGWERVAARLHPREREALRETGEAYREKMFYDLWVLKESFIKADGRGLVLPLDSFCVEARAGEVLRADGKIRGRDCFYRLYCLEEEGVSLGASSLDSAIAKQPVWMELTE